MLLDERKKQYLKQFFQFISVSGVGFLMDFSIYTVLTSKMNVSVSYANMLSAIPAITWVFIFSTRKIFMTNGNKFGLIHKYVVYLCYQVILLIAVSYLAQWIYDILYPNIHALWIIGKYLNLFCKCLITPITMICNFMVMKFLAERM